MGEEVKYNESDWFCGYKFIKWGLGFFLFGILVGFGILINYLKGSHYQVSDAFLHNITLWFGSPLSMSVFYLQLGGLGMAALGAAKLLIFKLGHEAGVTHSHRQHGNGSLILCVIGLIALFVTGYIGYFVIDGIWPGFYYAPIVAGKNLWLVLQGLSIVCYFIGLILAFCCVCRCRHCAQCSKCSK